MQTKIASAGQAFGRLLVTAFIVSETFRSVFTFAAKGAGVKILSPGILDLCSNACLGALSLAFLLGQTRHQHGGLAPATGRLRSCLDTILSAQPRGQWNAYGALMLPSLLHLASSILFRIALKFTTLSVLYVVILAKIPITAFLHHVLCFKQRDYRVWLSLVLLIAGGLLLYLPSGLSAWVYQLRGERNHEFSEIFGCFLGFLIACLLSVSSVFTETLFKQPVPFWVTQFWLGLFGIIFAGLGSACFQDVFENRYLDEMVFAVKPLATEPTLRAHIIANLVLVAATAITSLRASIILRKDDNLAQISADAVCVVTAMLTKWVLFEAFRRRTLTEFTVLGGGMIILFSWTYLFYKRSRLPAYMPLNTSSCEMSDLGRPSPALDDKHDTRVGVMPTRKRVLLAGVFVALLGYAQHLSPTMARHGASPAHGRPNAGDNGNSAANQPPITPHPNPVTTKPTVDDIERFFKPHNIAPATWGQTDSAPNCIVDWIDRKQVYPISTKFTDWEYSFAASGCPVYPIPKGGMVFHQYWTGQWRPFNEVNIAAFLATQRLGDGHRMIYWYNDGGPPESVRRRFQPYADFVEFKELDAAKEAEGTCVANMPEWNSPEYRSANSMQLVAMSDIIRNLLLSKYGGVWLDADTIPLRDLTPMIRSGPSACSINDQDWNNNVLVFGPPNTTVTNRILETTCSLSTNETAYREKFGPEAITPLFWHWMWNDGLFKHCVRNNCGVSRIPVYFTDGWGWFGKGQRALKPCDPGERWWHDSEAPLPRSLRTLFTWHPRLGQYDDSCLGPGTLVAAVIGRIDELLGYGLEMRGRDLFPGPALVTRDVDMD